MSPGGGWGRGVTKESHGLHEGPLEYMCLGSAVSLRVPVRLTVGMYEKYVGSFPAALVFLNAAMKSGSRT